MGNQQGVTLIELVVALAILAILAGIAWPNMVEWRNREGIDRASMVLKAAIGDMRSRSVQNGLYWGETDEPQGGGGTCRRLYFGIQISPGDLSAQRIYFCDLASEATRGQIDNANEIGQLGPRCLNGREANTGNCQTSPVAVTTSTGDFGGDNRFFFTKTGDLFQSGSSGTIALEAGAHGREVIISDDGRVREELQ